MGTRTIFQQPTKLDNRILCHCYGDNPDFISRYLTTGAFNRLRQLEILFESKLAQLGGQLIGLEIKEVEPGFTITAAVVALEGEILSSELLQIQEELSETMEAPVIIRATLLSGTQINLEPTATPASTP